MMDCHIHPLGTAGPYKFVVVLSRYRGQLLLSRHRRRTTWETQGGHIEAGEEPIQAAHRELREESGALDYTLRPLCDYWAGTPDDHATGMVFLADITRLGELPQDFEMAQVGLFDTLPAELSYPQITPRLYAFAGDFFGPRRV